jgi:ribose 5-phosphate isomerase B
MRVILGTDHGGFELKEKIKLWLGDKGYEVVDIGASSLEENDDFVDYAKKAVLESEGKKDRVVLFCSNGFGMSIAANRFVGVRCGFAFDKEAVRRGRADDDINCLAVPAMYLDEVSIIEMIDIFLTEKFSDEEKYKRRINKLDSLF